MLNTIGTENLKSMAALKLGPPPLLGQYYSKYRYDLGEVMMSLKTNIRIKYAGNDLPFPDLDAALKALSTNFCSKSVSLLYASNSLQMTVVVFIDVLPDGSLRKSYGNCEPLDIEWLYKDIAA